MIPQWAPTGEQGPEAARWGVGGWVRRVQLSWRRVSSLRDGAKEGFQPNEPPGFSGGFCGCWGPESTVGIMARFPQRWLPGESLWLAAADSFAKSENQTPCRKGSSRHLTGKPRWKSRKGIPPPIASVLEMREGRGPGPRLHSASFHDGRTWSFAVHFVGTRKGHRQFSLFYNFQQIFACDKEPPNMLLLIYQLIVDRYYSSRIFNTSIICPWLNQSKSHSINIYQRTITCKTLWRMEVDKNIVAVLESLHASKKRSKSN